MLTHTLSIPRLHACRQELLDNTAKLREQMAGARALAEKEQQEEYLRVKQMEAYERR